MGIAKVKIAPMENWCEYERKKMAKFPEVKYELAPGVYVKIETSSMKNSPFPEDCAGKTWKVLRESLDALEEITGGHCSDGAVFCEHMLELD